MWIGKDPDFNSVQDAAFARLRNVSPQTLLYKITLGMTLMDFTVKFASFLLFPYRRYLIFHARWRKIFESVYSLSLEYDGCGVGRMLLKDFIIGLDCPPEALAFII